MFQVFVTFTAVQDYLIGVDCADYFEQLEAITAARWQVLAAQALNQPQQTRPEGIFKELSNEVLKDIVSGIIEMPDQIASAKYKASL